MIHRSLNHSSPCSQARAYRNHRLIQAAAEAKCWLVGSGPGSVELMTVKSLQLLEQTKCVIYDDLASQDGLARCKPDTELVYVGKRGGIPSPKQPEICELLVRKCEEYKHVVRLKGGCVTIFSRVSEEIAALREHGIDYELVPGVSSAFAAPALAGFPLTDKNLGTSFAVMSAHSPDSIHWAELRSSVDTVVLLMTGKTFSAVVGGALESGWPADTSV